MLFSLLFVPGQVKSLKWIKSFHLCNNFYPNEFQSVLSTDWTAITVGTIPTSPKCSHLWGACNRYTTVHCNPNSLGQQVYNANFNAGMTGRM